jgi:von Willebrand factor type A domain
MTTFEIETYYNPYLPAGADELNAIVTVTASGTGAVAAGGDAPAAAEIVLLDVSGSMGGRTGKLREAKKATMAAVDALREGVRFAIVAGHEQAFMLYPAHGSMVEANEVTRDEAKAAVADVTAGGGTAIGTWLLEAVRLFPDEPGMIRHAILLTDGQNQNETAEQLSAAIDQCEGHFQCDCRGVGADWEVSELRQISTRLFGSVDVIARPEDMAEDFRRMTEQSMSKALAEVCLRIWTPNDARVQFVKEVNPNINDLTHLRIDVTPQIGDYPTGAWGDESRDYHVQVRFPPRDVNEEMRAARITLLVGPDQELGKTAIDVTWTEDVQLSTKQVPRLDSYVGQQESARLADEGFGALKQGDLETATARLVSAQEGYEKAGNLAQAEAIGQLLETGSDGTMRLKRDPILEKKIETGTTRTERLEPEP